MSILGRVGSLGNLVMKQLLTALSLFFSVTAMGQEVHLICTGEKTFHVSGFSVSPSNDPLTMTYNERKKMMESQLLSPTCEPNRVPLETCRCKFTKNIISCSGMSRSSLKEQPLSIWRFNFELNRVNGKLSGIKQFSNSGNSNEFNHNEHFDYQCNKASPRF